MSPASHLVPNPPAHENGHGQPVTQTRFEELLHRIDRQVRERDQLRPRARAGLWDSGGDVERDNIAVIEVMTLVRESLATASR